MPSTEISGFPAASALAGSEDLAGTQSGANVRIAPSQLLTYLLAQSTLAELIQDTVGALMADTGDINFTYSDITPDVIADIKARAVTFAKMQAIATARLLGRSTAASGDIEELTLGTGLGFTGLALNLTGGRQTVWLPAAAMRPSFTGGSAALALVAVGANQPDISSLDFDSATQEHAQFSVAMPKSWNVGTMAAQFFWTHAATATNFGVRWGIQGSALGDSDNFGIAYGTAQEVTDTGGTTSDLWISAETPAFTIGNVPTQNDLVMFRVYRAVANAADTMAVDAKLIGVKLFFNTNAGSDD
jgi:hypothetical protein